MPGVRILFLDAGAICGRNFTCFVAFSWPGYPDEPVVESGHSYGVEELMIAVIRHANTGLEFTLLYASRQSVFRCRILRAQVFCGVKKAEARGLR